jgi:hypothetical protein
MRPPAWNASAPLAPPRHFEGVTTLGPIRSVWTTKEGALLMPTILTIIGGGLLTGAVVVGWIAKTPLAGGGLLLPAVILLSIGAWHWRLLGSAASTVVVYEEGFAARIGSRVSLWPWQAITAIVSDLRFASASKKYVVSNQSGDAVVLIDARFEEVQSLMESIKRHVRAVLLPSLQRAYDDGTPITFGPVTVSREGVAARGRQLPWGAIGNVDVKDGRLVIAPRNGEKIEVRASRIPNIELLGELIGVNPVAMDLTYM